MAARSFRGDVLFGLPTEYPCPRLLRSGQGLNKVPVTVLSGVSQSTNRVGILCDPSAADGMYSSPRRKVLGHPDTLRYRISLHLPPWLLKTFAGYFIQRRSKEGPCSSADGTLRVYPLGLYWRGLTLP